MGKNGMKPWCLVLGAFVAGSFVTMVTIMQFGMTMEFGVSTVGDSEQVIFVKTVEPVRAVPKKEKLVIAYCAYTQVSRTDYPSRAAEWLAYSLAKGMAPYQVELFPCSATEESISGEQKMEPEDLIQELGLNADIRICPFGTTSIVNTLKRLKNGTVWRKSREDIPQGYTGWASKNTVKIPKFLSYIGDKETGERVGPLLVRQNFEPWIQTVGGVDVQLETKTSDHLMPRDSVGLYLPHIVESLGRRLHIVKGDTASLWQRRHGCCFRLDNTVSEAVFRGKSFNASKERSGKVGFAAFLQANCHTYSISTAIRHAFIFLLSAQYKPVSAAGPCPRGPNADKLLGIEHSRRRELQRAYKDSSSLQVYNDFKFAIVFENSMVDGYFSEKILDAYLGKAIPVYWGPPNSTQRQYLNPEAYVQCYVPVEFASPQQLRRVHERMCDKHTTTAKELECFEKFDLVLKREYGPYFASCIEKIRYLDSNDTAYEEMLSQPLVPDGKLVGFWDLKSVGATLRDLYNLLIKNETTFFNPEEVQMDTRASLQ